MSFEKNVCAAALASLIFTTACDPAARTPMPIPAPRDAGVTTDAAQARAAEPPTPVAPTCEMRIAERHLAAPSARHLAYVDSLPEVLVRAQIDPVLFLRWPDATPPSAPTAALRRELDTAAHPTRALRDFLAAHPSRALRREVLLEGGYFFSDRPALASALSAQVQLTTLFDAPRIYRSRDGVVDVLDRTDRDADEPGYLEADGSLARLRLNDRVSESADALADPLGLDLEVVREETGALRTIPTAIGDDAAALDLVFPDGTRRPSLAVLANGRTEIACIGGAPETLDATRADASAFWARHHALVRAAQALVDEAPRFDEPMDEPEGVQEDGQLRGAWLAAYLAGETTFVYGTVEYPVFDEQGRPIPPEVCIDFVLDAWQRGGGTWFRGEGEAPGRTHGSLDLAPAGPLPRRSLENLLDYASGEGAVLDRFDVESENLVPLARGAAYAHAIARSADAFREGDALVVYGLRLQDMRNHHHALLVLRTDPMTGVPMVVADNQGRPALRTLTSAMQAAPLRSIAHRLRLDLVALEEARANGVDGPG
ncbi:MAG: hypothetical protein U0234_27540 [Sandaracinus sp.]